MVQTAPVSMAIVNGISRNSIVFHNYCFFFLINILIAKSIVKKNIPIISEYLKILTVDILVTYTPYKSKKKKPIIENFF